MTAAASSQKHTPGPWTTHGDYVYAGPERHVSGRIAIADGERYPQRTRYANAVLIAEAPAMLAALERVCNAYEALIESNGVQAVIGSENAPYTAGDWVKRRMADAMADARAVAVAAGRGSY